MYIQNGRHVLEEFYGTVNGHIEHIGNTFSFEAYLESLVVIAFTSAYLAWYEYVR